MTSDFFTYIWGTKEALSKVKGVQVESIESIEFGFAIQGSVIYLG